MEEVKNESNHHGYQLEHYSGEIEEEVKVEEDDAIDFE